jgi:hypothetical protein
MRRNDYSRANGGCGKIGGMTAHAGGPRARSEETRRRHATAITGLETIKPANLVGRRNLQPQDSADAEGHRKPVIMSALGVSVTYAVAIRAGRCKPHPRHWEKLVGLVGFADR